MTEAYQKFGPRQYLAGSFVKMWANDYRLQMVKVVITLQPRLPLSRVIFRVQKGNLVMASKIR